MQTAWIACKPIIPSQDEREVTNEVNPVH
jgi:hypothetical protein